MTVALMPQHGTLRVLRGSVLTAVNAVLAVAAHVAAGAAVPDGALTVLLTVGVAAAGTALADRQRGPLALLAAVAVTQVILHLLLDALGAHHAATAGVAAGDTSGAAGGAVMTAAHAAAVVVTAALLAGAESALFTVAGALRRIVGVLVALPARSPADQRTSTLPVAAPLPTGRRLCCAGTSLRGPPRSL
ncbi:MAG: hypothetical protein ACRDRV_08415 [Pseudonocardiaceae bacterium]